MKLHHYIIMFVMGIGVILFMGTMFIDTAQYYNVDIGGQFSDMVTGEDYQQFTDDIEDIKDSAEEDGWLAQFKIARALYTAVKNTFSVAENIISNLGSFLGIPSILTAFIIVILIISVIFAGIYFLRGNN